MQAHSKVLLFLFVGGLCVSVAVSASKPISSEVLVRTGESPSSKVIAGYKNWTQVNTVPHLVSSQLSGQCAAPTALQLSMENKNPHLNKFVLVYVNDIGKAPMMEQKVPVFPEGSVIVKEKWLSKVRVNSALPELLTVMRKREAGYDPARGNWEYLVFDGAGQTLQASGKLENCQSCHIQQQATDYVSRSYLPATLWDKLR
jgi:hypothetical protein